MTRGRMCTPHHMQEYMSSIGAYAETYKDLSCELPLYLGIFPTKLLKQILWSTLRLTE